MGKLKEQNLKQQNLKQQNLKQQNLKQQNLKQQNLKQQNLEQEDLIQMVNQNLPEEEHLYDLADLFRIFGDSTRIKILFALLNGELCVNDLTQALSISQPTVSHQLRILRDAKLVRFQRKGKIILYSLADDHVRSILNIGMEHIEE